MKYELRIICTYFLCQIDEDFEYSFVFLKKMRFRFEYGFPSKALELL